MPPFYYRGSDSNRRLLCLSKRAQKVKCCVYLDSKAVFYVPLYCLQTCSNLLLSCQVKKQVVTTEIPIQCPDAESLDLSGDLIIARFNRFMAAIQWHMSAGLSAIVRFLAR